MLPEKRAWVHQAWSGDVVNAQYYLPEGESIDNIGYWYPADGGGMIGSDTMAVHAQRRAARCSPTSSSTTCSTPTHALDELRLARLPAAAERASTRTRSSPTACVPRPPRVRGDPARGLRDAATSCSSCPWPASGCGTTPGRSSPPAERLSASRAPAGRNRARACGRRSPLPGVVWLVLLLRRPVLRRAGGRLRRPRPDLRQRRPGLEPARSGTSRSSTTSSTGSSTPSSAEVFCARSSTSAPRSCHLLPHRLPGRLLRGPLRRAAARSAARPAPRPVLDQLPDADAGLGQPAPGGRLRQRRPGALHLGLGAGELARRAGPITVVLGLVYGYVPFFILPLFAALDRIDRSVLEASRDLGMGPAADVPAGDAAAVASRACWPPP